MREAVIFRAQDIAHEMPGSYGLLTGRKAAGVFSQDVTLLTLVSAARDGIVSLRGDYLGGLKDRRSCAPLKPH